MELLKDKVTVITGGTRGIGFETARLFLEQGAKVIIFGSRQESVDKALKELAGAEGYYPDLGSYETVDQTIQEILQKHGHIDILINNAGISAEKPIEETSAEDFDNILKLNLSAMFYAIKSVVPSMKEQGHGVILNTSSMVATYGQPTGVGYPASKFAVNGLTKSLARELAPSHIRVNAVAPGVIKTSMMEHVPEELIAPVIKSIPLGRVGTPRDIANAFLFLASDYADYITGAILPVDGAARS